MSVLERVAKQITIAPTDDGDGHWTLAQALQAASDWAKARMDDDVDIAQVIVWRHAELEFWGVDIYEWGQDDA